MTDHLSLLDRISLALGVSRRLVLGFVLAVMICLTAPLAVQGIVVRYAVTTADSAKDASISAKETAEIADAATNPDCDKRTAACKRANQQRAGGQGNPVPDIEEVSVIASYCGHVPTNDTLPEVRACVTSEFQRLTGRLPTLTSPTTTTTPGG